VEQPLHDAFVEELVRRTRELRLGRGDEGVLDGFAGVLELLYGEGVARKLGKAWQHRRALARLGRRYLSGS
jgi:hypothetical protein